MKKFDIKSMILCAMFTAIIVVCTYIRIDTGIIAFTLQSLAVLLAALILGSTHSTISVAVYIALGVLGLPVFTSGGGIGSFLTPSFGFVIGFLPMTFVVGYLSRRGNGKFKSILIATIVGTLVLYVIGLAYGYVIFNIYLGKGMSIGKLLWTFVGIFIPIDICKCLVSSAVGAKIIPILNKVNKTIG